VIASFAPCVSHITLLRKQVPSKQRISLSQAVVKDMGYEWRRLASSGS